jgi:hypothetical protein
MPMSAIALAQVKPRSPELVQYWLRLAQPAARVEGLRTAAGRAMAVALDYIDWFATARSLASLAALEGEFARL